MSNLIKSRFGKNINEEDIKLELYYQLRRKGVYCQCEVIVKTDRIMKLDVVVFDKYFKAQLIVEIKNGGLIKEDQLNKYMSLGLPVLVINSMKQVSELSQIIKSPQKFRELLRKYAYADWDSFYQEYSLSRPLNRIEVRKFVKQWKIVRTKRTNLILT